MKNYLGISRDHSGSMGCIAHAAARDYNENIAAIKEAAIQFNQDTIVSVVKCGTGRSAQNLMESTNSSVVALKPLAAHEYNTDGSSTPLFDSVGMLIETLEAVPDANDPDVSFLIMVITDGGDNSSRKWSAASLARKIADLQRTDRWTFTFRVPRGEKRGLVAMGIPAGNIQEWEQTERGMQQATVATRAAVTSFYDGRSKGLKSSDKFYTDLSGVSSKTVATKLVDVSTEVQFFTVANATEGSALREFCESKTGKPLLKGSAFYQLVKSEPKVQDYKQIAIRDKSNGKVFSGVEARNLLGLPHNGDVKLAPANHSHYDIFIQSTSVNRKLPVGTQVMYWEKIGEPYKEGKSSR